METVAYIVLILLTLILVLIVWGVTKLVIEEFITAKHAWYINVFIILFAIALVTAMWIALVLYFDFIK